MDEPWRKQVEELDMEVLGAQALAEGARWPAFAVACALIDADAISKKRLLEIIDALHSIVSVDATDRLVETEDLALGLERFRGFLEATDLQPGRVVEELQRLESTSLHRQTLREERRRRSDE